jgi:hypothetical protein
MVRLKVIKFQRYGSCQILKTKKFLENVFRFAFVCVHMKLQNLKNKFQRGGFMCRLGRRENSKAYTKKLMGIIQ